MKEVIPDEYPHQLNIDEVKDLASKYANNATRVSKRANTIFGATYWHQMSELGQTEISLRNQLELNSILADLKTENRKSGFINLALSLLTILLAIVTITVSIKSLDFAESDQISDEVWKDEQIKVLNENKEALEKLTKEIQEINKKDKELKVK